MQYKQFYETATSTVPKQRQISLRLGKFHQTSRLRGDVVVPRPRMKVTMK